MTTNSKEWIQYSTASLMTTNMQDGDTPTFDLCLVDYDAMKLRTVRVGTGSDRELDLAQ